MTAVEKVIALAHAELGYIEKRNNDPEFLDDKYLNAGTNNYTKYARDMDALGDYFHGKKQGSAWCAVFVNWLFVQCFGEDKALEALYLPKDNYAASCKYAVRYYQAAKQFRTSEPNVGDQIFFLTNTSYSHTGIVVEVDDNYVTTIEGNTSDKAGVVAQSTTVCKKKYPIEYARIGGYGRPNWELLEERSEMDKLIDQLTDEQAYRILQKAQNHANTLPCPSYFKKEMAEAVALGITDGTAPQGLAIRSQVAVMVLRGQKQAQDAVAEYILGGKDE